MYENIFRICGEMQQMQVFGAEGRREGQKKDNLKRQLGHERIPGRSDDSELFR